MEGLVARSRKRVRREDADVELLAAGLGPLRARGNERSSVLRVLLAFADLLAATSAGIMGAALSGLSLQRGLVFAIVVALSWPLTSFVFGLYAASDLRSWASGISEIPRLVVAAVFLSWPLVFAASLLGARRDEGAALLAIVVIVLVGVLTRAGARWVVHRSRPLRQRTVIVGSGLVADQLVRKLKAHGEFGLEPFGFVDDDIHHYNGPPSLPNLGRIDELSHVLQTYGVDRVIIAFSRASHEQLLHCIRACRDMRVAVDVVPRLFEFLDGARATDQIGGLPLLSIGAPRLSRSSRVAKRVLDVAVAVSALTLLSPLFAFIALAIKMESRGQVLFRQPRAGRNGSVFEVLKFRSMYADAEHRKNELAAINEAQDGVMFKIRRDPRVTRIGRLLRRYSVDEMPQLLNVLKGDMSLVGPRPLILPETEALEAWGRRRLDLRPGLTGPWQVSGRSDVPFQEMIRFDYQYVAGWSLARDVEILLATVPAVLSGRGAY